MPKAKLWQIPTDRFIGLTAIEARNLIVECFFFAHCETFARAGKSVGMGMTGEDDVRRMVRASIRSVFTDNRDDFDRPTAKSLRRAVQALALKAEGWGTPKDIIEHHGAQIEEVLDHLEQLARQSL